MQRERGTGLIVNGTPVSVDGDPGSSLLHALREQLGLYGVRPGCTSGECGSCTVLVDGAAVQSCQTTVADAAGRSVLTPEGLRTEGGDHPVLEAFLQLEAAQCGYCVNGVMMRVAGLMDAPDGPTDIAQLAQALAGQLCRCGTHARLLEAAAKVVLGASAPTVSTCEVRRCDPCPVGPRPGQVASTGDEALLPGLVAAAPDVSDWLRVTSEGRIEVLTGRSEIGQAVHTALRQIVASHLGVAPAIVDVVPPTTTRSRDEGFTAGSKSIMEGGEALAMAATALRRIALDRAASRLRAPVDLVKLDQDGSILGPGEGTIAIGALFDPGDGDAIGPITGADAPDWGLSGLGQPERRRDLEAKLTGGAFLQDLVLPGMLHAKVVLPPSARATLVSTDTEGIRSIDGVAHVVHDGRLLVVIAHRESIAVRAAAALEARTRWEDPGLALDGSILTTMRAQPSRPFVARQDEGVDAALASGRSVSATYTRPYQSHGSVSPSVGVAWFRDGALEVWSHTQGVFQLRAEIVALLGDRVTSVEVHHVDGPGSYGQNAADDAAALAALIALAVPGSPVRLHLSVSDEFRWEPYGSIMASDLQASIDDEGRILAWRHRTLTDGHMNRPSGQGSRTIAAWLREDGVEPPGPPVTEGGARNIVPIYALERVEAIAEHTRGPLRSGSLRSLGAFQNVFAQESFMDEVAEAAGTDPIAFRLAHLEDPRAREVLMAAAEASGWVPHVGPSGRGFGVALSRYHDELGYAAVVAEVTVDVDADVLAVRRLVIASDLGTVINLEGARQQLEGGALQGVSRTLFEELRVDRRGVRTDGWETYPVLRFPDVPRIDIVLLDRHGAPPLGAGEVSTPPVPAAIANAVDDATGVRLRDLPITVASLRERVLAMEEHEMSRVLLG
jgi:nicotinate dehydrogenase subunit B